MRLRERNRKSSETLCRVRLRQRFDELHPAFGADPSYAVGFAAIGYESGDLRKMADTNRSRTLEFARIAHEHDLPRVRQYRLRHPHLAVVVVEERAVLIDSRGADHRKVHLELADEIDCRLPDDPAVAVPHDAAGDHHLDLRV